MTEKKHTLTIGGEPPKWGSIDELVTQLQALPSSYAERRRIFTPEIEADEHSPAGKEFLAGLNTIEAQVSSDHYKRAGELYAEEGKPLEQANALSHAGKELLLFIPPYMDQHHIPAEDALAFLSPALAAHEGAKQLDLAYFDCCDLYTAQSKIFAHYKSIGDTERVQKASDAMAILRIQARELNNALYGGADPEAHRVEEGEIGFSDDERLGTDMVSHCVTLLVRDPKTHKTAIAHIDFQIDIQSLDQLFENFGEAPLEVRLLGASHTQSDYSKNNLETVMRYLTNKNVNIISADILQGPNAPANAVVDPHDFSVTEKIPALTTINAAIGNGVLSLCKQIKPLEVQFDLTKSKERLPIFLSRNALQAIRNTYVPKDEAEIEHHLAKLPYLDRPLAVNDKLKLIGAYQKEWSALQKTLEHTITAQGVDAEHAGRARAALEKQRFYIGEHAAEANAPIHAWIEDTLLVDGKFQFSAQEGIRLDDRINRLPTYVAKVEASTAQNGAGAAK